MPENVSKCPKFVSNENPKMFKEIRKNAKKNPKMSKGYPKVSQNDVEGKSVKCKKIPRAPKLN